MVNPIELKQRSTKRVLTAENAEITTVAVSVGALTISGKQVTLAVFRQLIVEPIVTWNPVKLNGVGWGHVNYLMEPQDLTAGIVHLVWQKGNELRRCKLAPDANKWRREYLEYAVRWNRAERTSAVSENIIGDIGGVPAPWLPHDKVLVTPIRRKIVSVPRGFGGGSDHRIDWEYNEQFRSRGVWNSEICRTEYPKEEEDNAKAKTDKWFEDAQAARDIARDFDQYGREEYSRLIDIVNGQCDDYDEIVQPLFDLPQLFIAV